MPPLLLPNVLACCANVAAAAHSKEAGDLSIAASAASAANNTAAYNQF